MRISDWSSDVCSSDLLGAASSHQPMLLVIDDLQWATTPTLLMLRHLVRTSSPLRCLIVATCRMGEPGAGEPLDDLVADLHRDRGVVTQLPLRGLSSDAIGDLIDTALRSGFDHEVADDLPRASRRERVFQYV